MFGRFCKKLFREFRGWQELDLYMYCIYVTNLKWILSLLIWIDDGYCGNRFPFAWLEPVLNINQFKTDFFQLFKQRLFAGFHLDYIAVELFLLHFNLKPSQSYEILNGVSVVLQFSGVEPQLG